MLQIVQSIDTGKLDLKDVPPPVVRPGMVRVRTAASLISAGTEKMLIDLAQKSIIGKAHARPDLVKQVLQKVKKDGLLNTYRNVQSKMKNPLPLGYSAAGVVDEIGEAVEGFSVGNRVAIAGAGYANHAEINVVPKNLVARMPDNVSFEDASYVTVASIALQGVRLAKPELGDNIAVIGLGLIGLITIQLLKSNGCRVIGFDLDESKVDMARKLGIDEAFAATGEDAIKRADLFTAGRGVDHTLITAATKNNAPIELAGDFTRRKGQVVVVGAVGMNIPRNVYYHKELGVKISMSYGPGRYDPSYEEGGIDYPYDYVRWTEQRNMEAVLDLIARNRLDVKSITSHRFEIKNALDAYGLIQAQTDRYIGIVLTYEPDKKTSPVVVTNAVPRSTPSGGLGIGFVGAGSYASQHLVPHLQRNSRVVLRGLVNASGQTARQKADQFGFDFCSSDIEAILGDDAIDAVFIASRHSQHAEYSIRALEAGKHVFVEKPMVVSEEQLGRVVETYKLSQQKASTGLMVGLNRRFAPMVTELRQAFDSTVPQQMIYRVNSGHIPTSSWLHYETEGGGMLVGEMCHFIDLMQYVTAERPVQVFSRSVSVGRSDVSDMDNLAIVITFSGGSVGTLNYNTLGDKAFPKERLEIYGGGTVAVLDDFRTLTISTNGKTTRKRSRNQDKGQRRQVTETVRAFSELGTAPIPFPELVSGMQAVFAARRSLQSGLPETVSS